MTASRDLPPSIFVLAGANGGGKSSVGGAAFRRAGAAYFNPDDATQRIREANPQCSLAEANGAAWHQGKRLLETAILARQSFAFETTLGGNTMTALLTRAVATGLAVRMWYVALKSPELHIARVQARVAAGGHDIPHDKIRERYDSSRENLVQLLPQLTELRVYDNSREGDPASGVAPSPELLLHLREQQVVYCCALPDVPAWARPIVAAGLRRR